MAPFQVALFVLCFLGSVVKVYSGSYWDVLEQKRLGGNRISEFCRTRGDLLLFPGSKVNFRNCFECNCDDDGLTCKTTYGLSLFGFSQCTRVIDDCKPLLVEKYNENLRCFSRIPTNKKVPKDSYREVSVPSIFG